MTQPIEITEARPEDALAIADIHLIARRKAMPWLARPHTDADTRHWYDQTVCDEPGEWWVARCDEQVTGYMLIQREDLEDLYILPKYQRRGIGRSFVRHAKALSPTRLLLWTFQRNSSARAFYQAQGFHAVAFTDGARNAEREPDVQYLWEPPSP